MAEARQESLIGREDAAWWRTAFLLAEIHNSGLSLVWAWGGGADRKMKTPHAMNPTLTNADRVSEGQTQTDQAFELARRSEEAKRKNGKQVKH